VGMAVVPPWDRKFFRAKFSVDANRDDTLTCMFCWGPRCEWTTTFRTGGRRVTVGLHEICIAAAESGASLDGAGTGEGKGE